MNINKIGSMLKQLKRIIKSEINIIEESGYIIESTNSNNIGEYDLRIKNNRFFEGIMEEQDKMYYFHEDTSGSKIIISIGKGAFSNKKVVEIVGFFLTQNFEEISSENLLKEALLEGIKENYLDNFLKKFNISMHEKMQVIVIEVDESFEYEVENLVHQVFPSGLIVKMHSNILTYINRFLRKNNEIEKNIYDAIYSELFYEPKIGVGTVVDNIKDIHKSYSKALESLKLGKTFNIEKNIFYYRDFALPALINNMNHKNLENLYVNMTNGLDEILLNSELKLTAIKFFENNLNISETAKKLYIHRNTLIYRLNKIKKISGYDLRNFEDSINFKIAMYIDSYLKTL